MGSSSAGPAKRSVRQAAHDLGQMVRYCWRAAPVATAAAITLPLMGATLPIIQTIFNGVLVGSVPPAIAGGPGSSAVERTYGLLLIVVVLLVGSILLGYASNLVYSYLGDRYALEGRRAVTDALNAPVGISHLEDSAVSDEVSFVLGGDQSWTWSSGPAMGYQVFNAWVQQAGAVVILASFRWWLPLCAAPAWVADWRHGAGFSAGRMFGNWEASAGLRRARYMKALATGPTVAKELRTFGLGGWAVARFRDQWTEAMESIWSVNRKGLASMGLAALAKLVAGFVLYGLLAGAALDGTISLTALAIFAPAALEVLGIGYMGDANRIVSQAAQLAGRARRLELDMADRAQSPDASLPVPPGSPSREIRFEAVSFGYPGSSDLVVDGLDLGIPAGHSLAIVGDNGAGKTTLIKMLCRLYEPSSGRITVDGQALDSLDVEEWRRRIAVIFQDFVRWPLSLGENVRFGADLRVDAHALDFALGQAGAAELLNDRSDRLSVPLSRAYADGTDLSGGQWQKVALARALAAVQAGAGVLVLDEPTASLDVRSEAEVFDRLLAATRGVTTVLVSHRFNTVRRADRIAVIDSGRVVEQGTHAELMERRGRYAAMYRLQADRFSEGEPTEPIDA